LRKLSVACVAAEIGTARFINSSSVCSGIQNCSFSLCGHELTLREERRFEVLTAVTLKSGHIVLRKLMNVGKLIPDYTVAHSGRQDCSYVEDFREQETEEDT
jgi:hypothetical protein